jgi:ssRNA-specific RNase YbeY (16S rRNA maturation enzyme)
METISISFSQFFVRQDAGRILYQHERHQHHREDYPQLFPAETQINEIERRVDDHQREEKIQDERDVENPTDILSFPYFSDQVAYTDFSFHIMIHLSDIDYAQEENDRIENQHQEKYPVIVPLPPNESGDYRA